MELNHYSHEHPLVLKEEDNQDPDKAPCYGCEEPVTGQGYCCSQCNFFLHKTCAEWPWLIKHHSHRKHPLFLTKNPYPRAYGGRKKLAVCDICQETRTSFVYHCSRCNFDLDVTCALPPCLMDPQSQPHTFVRLIRSIEFTCDECGANGDFCPNYCVTCHLMVHRECVSIDNTINVLPHHHPLTLSYYFQKFEAVERSCGICKSEIDIDYKVYFCTHCNYFAHVQCARKFSIKYFKFRSHKSNEAQPSESMDSSYSIIREVKPEGKEAIAVEIKHFSHPHNLILSDEFEDNKRCDGCMFQISPPFYSCMQCNFFLDKNCIELPRNKILNLTPLTFSLLPKAPTVDNMFSCAACGQRSHGFAYGSSTIKSYYDVSCMLLSEKLIHEGHEHLLLRDTELGLAPQICSACSRLCNFFRYRFRCVDCEFWLCAVCATRPRQWRHKYDKHILNLTYSSPIDENREFYCEICEQKRNPKHWFYSCAECDFAAHPECTFGKYPFIKLGGIFKHDIHPHPLTLVQKNGEFPPCDTCGLHCDGIALECTVSQCNFIVHRNYKCEETSSKQEHE